MPTSRRPRNQIAPALGGQPGLRLVGRERRQRCLSHDVKCLLVVAGKKPCGEQSDFRQRAVQGRRQYLVGFGRPDLVQRLAGSGGRLCPMAWISARSQRRWPRRLGAGGRGGYDRKGRRRRKPPINPGLLASLDHLLRLSEGWVIACRTVWRPNLKLTVPEEQAEAIVQKLAAVSERLAELKKEMQALEMSIKKCKKRIAGH